MNLLVTGLFLPPIKTFADPRLVWVVKAKFPLTMTADFPRHSDGLYPLAALPFNAYANHPLWTASYNLTVARHHERSAFMCNTMPSELRCRQLPYQPLQTFKFQLSLPKFKHRWIYPWRRRIDVLSRTLLGAGRYVLPIRCIRHLPEHSWRASKYSLDIDSGLAVCSYWPS